MLNTVLQPQSGRVVHHVPNTNVAQARFGGLHSNFQQDWIMNPEN